jgi:hypothetical protein
MQNDIKRSVPKQLISDSTRRALRSRSVGTKITEEEYQRLIAQMGEKRLSEWVRTALMNAASSDRAVHAILAEMIALRMIVVNLVFNMANGHQLTPEEMRSLIDLADRDKSNRASERLAKSRGGRDGA